MVFVNGKDVIVYTYFNGAWRMYGCGRSCTLSIATSTIETSTTGSGIWATFKPQKNSFSGSIDGIVNLEPGEMITIADLQNLQITLQPLLMRFSMVDALGNDYICEGTFYITNSSITGSVNDVATFSIELIGSGELVQNTDS